MARGRGKDASKGDGNVRLKTEKQALIGRQPKFLFRIMEEESSRTKEAAPTLGVSTLAYASKQFLYFAS